MEAEAPLESSNSEMSPIHRNTMNTTFVGSNMEPTPKSHINETDRHHNNNNKEKIMDEIDAFSIALAQTKKIYGENHANVAVLLNRLGVLHYQNMSSDNSGSSSADEAIELFEKSLFIRRQTLGNHHLDVATSLSNIGRVYYERGLLDSALTQYMEALEIRANSLGVDSLEYAITAFNSARCYYELGNRDMALSLYKAFLRVAQVKLGKTDEHVINVYSCIALIHMDREEWSQAIPYLFHVIECWKVLQLYPGIARVYSIIGNLFLKLKDLDNSLQAFLYCLHIQKSFFSELCHTDNNSVLRTLAGICEIYLMKGDYVRAIKFHQELLISQKSILGDYHPDVAHSYYSLGRSYYHYNRDLETTLYYFKHAYILQVQVLGRNHLDVAATLYSIGKVLEEQGSIKALEVFSQSLSIREIHHGKHHRDVSSSRYKIATIHHRYNQFNDAIECYTEILKTYTKEQVMLACEEEQVQQYRRDIALIYYRLGQANRGKGDINIALEFFKKAFDMLKNIPRNHNHTVLTAKVLNDMGNIYLQEGKVDSMMEMFSEASRIFKSLAGEEWCYYLRVEGCKLYGFDEFYPECAAVA